MYNIRQKLTDKKESFHEYIDIAFSFVSKKNQSTSIAEIWKLHCPKANTLATLGDQALKFTEELFF